MVRFRTIYSGEPPFHEASRRHSFWNVSESSEGSAGFSTQPSRRARVGTLLSGFTRQAGTYGIMREFVFTVEYEKEADEVMDLFIDRPASYARSMEINTTSEAVWRIDTVVGPAAVGDRGCAWS